MNGKEFLIKLLSFLTLVFIIFATYYYFTEVIELNSNQAGEPQQNNVGDDDPSALDDDELQKKVDLKTAALTALVATSRRNDEGFFKKINKIPDISFAQGDPTHICFTFDELEIVFQNPFVGYMLVEFINNEAGEILVFISNENYSIRFKKLEDFGADSNEIYQDSVGTENFGCPTGLISKF